MWGLSREDKLYKSGQTYLQNVAAAAHITNAVITVDKEEDEIQLVGFVRGLPLRIVMRASTEFRRIELQQEKDMAMIEIWTERRSDTSFEIGPGLYVAQRGEAIRFRKLPAPLRARLVDALRAANLESLSKYPHQITLSPKHKASEIKDAVAWLANALVATADLVIGLGSGPPIPEYEKRSEAAQWAEYEALASQIAKAVGGTIEAKPDDEKIVITWVEHGEQLQLVLDAGFFKCLDVSMSGFAGYFRLAWEPYPGKLEPGDVRLWLAPDICVEGEPEFANAIVARLRSLPPADFTALCTGIVENHIDGFGVEDGEYGGTITSLRSICDGGASAIAFARLVRRVADVLPRE